MRNKKHKTIGVQTGPMSKIIYMIWDMVQKTRFGTQAPLETDVVSVYVSEGLFFAYICSTCFGLLYTSPRIWHTFAHNNNIKPCRKHKKGLNT